MYVCKSASSAPGRCFVKPIRPRIGTALLVLLASPIAVHASDSPGKVPDAIVRGIETNTWLPKKIVAKVLWTAWRRNG